MIEILKEVTDWGPDSTLTNGIYHVNAAGELVGYEVAGTNFKKFSKPMKRFSKARRKFIKLGEYEDEDKTKDEIIVKGSKGQTYVIRDGKCSCPGFRFRGDCKHIREHLK